MATYGSGIFATYMIVVAVIYFFPLLFTLRFANKMRAALNGNDQQALNTSFQNLKACFRYIGIITIIALVFLAIGLVFGIMGAAAFS
jgi:predicted secreted protein